MDKNLEKPAGLSKLGEKAYDTIMAVLIEHGATETGGCKAFYSPAEWKARGERYGLGSELIIVYDGGDHGRFFSHDLDFPKYTCLTRMVEALKKVGVYSEECTGWYAAIHK